ncbi:MAG TPA: hypothetical protein VD905_04070, partial [Flavobacteriales bacterium]|nr:hypothetical protein [Flavobacteriales bacterium]
MRNLLVCILAFFYVCNASAQVKWKHKPFSEKCFVENKGQVNPTVIIKEPVLFTAQVDGNNYYFTQHYFYIAQPVKSKTPRAEIKKYLQSFNRFIQEEENEEVYEKLEYTFKEEFLEFGWKNTSPYCKVWPGKKVNHYYSYGGPALKNGKQTILANAFETLRYNNLYDGIDLVFEFPADSTGIKYHFEVQQSANVNDIVLVLPEAAKPTMVAGNVEMKASFGKITDHAPVSFCHGTHAPVKSTCQLRGNELSFKLDETARNGLVIIDPWVAVPSFSSSSKAFDVDYDSNGFTYAHGGASPFQIQKFDPTGALVWTYTPSFTGFSSYYGDFAVDRVSNRIYVVQGFNPGGGSEVIKINSSAIVEATYGGDPQFVEMWRIAFSRCSNQAVIAGGGISSPTYQTCYLDTNLTSLTPVQFVPTTGCCHDVGLLALDDLGNAYECTNRRASFDGIYDNRLVKLPLPAMLPETYNVATDYLFIEAGSVYYYGGSPANGFNGMSTYGDQVYTYDGFVLKKFDGPTGAQTVYKRIHMPADSTEMYWGGLTSDNCGNLFLGIQDTVEQYNASLNLLNTYVQPGTVYDVVFGTNGNLYVCGDGFVTEILPDSVTPCVSGGLNTVLTVNDANCTSPGSASVSITGGVGPYDIVWNTTPPQTNDTITNVPPGTYIVTVTEKSCFHEVTVDTFNIDTVGGAFIPVSQMYPGCGSGASIDIDILGGHGPFTYTWTPSAPNTDSIFGLVPGTYTVDIVDDATCTGSITVVVDTAVPPNYNLVAPLFCVGDTGTVQLVITGPDGPFTINWSSPVGASGSVLHGVTAGVYSGIIVNNSGCMQKFTDTILASPAITVSSTAGFD